MIPLAMPQMSGNEGRYLQECVDTNFVSSVGPFVDRFETMVAGAAGASSSVATSAGTTGLHAALTAVGVAPGDLVVLPSLTFIASANAIAHCGAQPWLFDVKRESWTLDAQQVGNALTRDTERRDGTLRHRSTGRRVAAILPVYTMGLPADMDGLMAIARDFGLPVVADAAAALGASYKKRPSGALGANLTVYSFNGNKTVTAGGGGAVAGDEAELCALVRHLTTTARAGADYTHDRVGFNYRMTNIQAAVGCAQMEQLDRFVARKRAIARRYDDELAALDSVEPFPNPDWAESACWFSGIVINSARGKVVDIRAALRERGVDARPFWKPMHLQPPFKDAPLYGASVSEEVFSTILTLPCSTSLTDVQQTQVIDAVKKCLA